jgi:hypothetical protein
MALRNLPVLVLLSVLAACSSPTSGSGGTETATNDDPTPGKVDDDSGQTGSIGQAECTEDAQCIESVQTWLAEFEMPATYFHHFDSSSCGQVGIIAGADSAEGLACQCHVTGGGGGGLVAGPAGAACSDYGRRLDCIYPGSEFPGCDPDDPKSCDAICADLQARLQADAMLSYETEIRSAHCQDYHCLSVVRIGDSCYPGPPLRAPHDCAMSDQEILDAAGP